MIKAVEVKIPIYKQGSDRQNRKNMEQKDLLARWNVGFSDRTGQEEPVMSVAVSNLLVFSRVSIIL